MSICRLCWTMTFTMCFTLIVDTVARSQSTEPPASDPAAALDAYASAARNDWKIPGLSLAVVKRGQVVLAKGYGVLEIGTIEPVDENTLFAIGSTTKAMTAATLGLLVDEKKLSFSDPVIRHWPEFRLKDPFVTQEITVRDLLIHRAGLANADYLWYGWDRTREQVLAEIGRIEPLYSFRAGFEYHNVMYVAAGELAARVSGMSWEDLLQQRLFQPLSMTRSTAHTSAAQLQSNVARPHAIVDNQVTRIENHPLDGVAPAGAVWSSALDMSRWLTMLLGNGEYQAKTILSPEVIAEMLRPQTYLRISDLYPYFDWFGPRWQAYGLGWFLVDYHGRFVCFHTGSIDGMAALAGIVPEEELGIVVLQNLNGANLRHALLWKCLDLFGGDQQGRDWNRDLHEFYGQLEEKARQAKSQASEQRQPNTRPSLPMARYAGRFEHPAYGPVLVTEQDGKLRLKMAPLLTADLEHWHFDTFLMHFHRRWQDSLLINFQLGTDGQVACLQFADRIYRRSPAD